MRYELGASWLGDEVRAHFAVDTVSKRIVSKIFQDDKQGAVDEVARLNELATRETNAK